MIPPIKPGINSIQISLLFHFSYATNNTLNQTQYPNIVPLSTIMGQPAPTAVPPPVLPSAADGGDAAAASNNPMMAMMNPMMMMAMANPQYMAMMAQQMQAAAGGAGGALPAEAGEEADDSKNQAV